MFIAQLVLDHAPPSSRASSPLPPPITHPILPTCTCLQECTERAHTLGDREHRLHFTVEKTILASCLFGLCGCARQVHVIADTVQPSEGERTCPRTHLRHVQVHLIAIKVRVEGAACARGERKGAQQEVRAQPPRTEWNAWKCVHTCRAWRATCCSRVHGQAPCRMQQPQIWGRNAPAGALIEAQRAVRPDLCPACRHGMGNSIGLMRTDDTSAACLPTCLPSCHLTKP